MIKRAIASIKEDSSRVRNDKGAIASMRDSSRV
jgi:hypothetical protein